MKHILHLFLVVLLASQASLCFAQTSQTAIGTCGDFTWELQDGTRLKIYPTTDKVVADGLGTLYSDSYPWNSFTGVSEVTITLTDEVNQISIPDGCFNFPNNDVKFILPAAIYSIGSGSFVAKSGSCYVGTDKTEGEAEISNISESAFQNLKVFIGTQVNISPNATTKDKDAYFSNCQVYGLYGDESALAGFSGLSNTYGLYRSIGFYARPDSVSYDVTLSIDADTYYFYDDEPFHARVFLTDTSSHKLTIAIKQNGSNVENWVPLSFGSDYSIYTPWVYNTQSDSYSCDFKLNDLNTNYRYEDKYVCYREPYTVGTVSWWLDEDAGNTLYFRGSGAISSSLLEDIGSKYDDLSTGNFLNDDYVGSVSEIYIYDGITSIENKVFKGLSGLSNVHIPASVTSMSCPFDSECFSDGGINIDLAEGSPFSILESVQSPGTVLEYIIYRYLVEQKDSDTRIIYALEVNNCVIPEEVTSIDDGAFGKIQGLNVVYIQSVADDVWKPFACSAYVRSSVCDKWTNASSDLETRPTFEIYYYEVSLDASSVPEDLSVNVPHFYAIGGDTVVVSVNDSNKYIGKNISFKVTGTGVDGEPINDTFSQSTTSGLYYYLPSSNAADITITCSVSDKSYSASIAISQESDGYDELVENRDFVLTMQYHVDESGNVVRIFGSDTLVCTYAQQRLINISGLPSGYTVARVYYQDATATSQGLPEKHDIPLVDDGQYLYTQPDECNVSILVLIKRLYDITVHSAESISGGTLTCSKSQSFEGDTITFTLTPNVGYQASYLNVGYTDANTSHSTNLSNNLVYNTAKYVMPAASVNVYVLFATIDYSLSDIIRYNPSTEEPKRNGSVLFDEETTKSVFYADTVNFDVFPDEGFEFARMLFFDEEGNYVMEVKADPKNTSSQYSFIMPPASLYYEPQFRRPLEVVSSEEVVDSLGNVNITMPAESPESLAEIFTAMADPTSNYYAGADIVLNDNIAYTPVDLSLDNATADDILSLVPSLPTIENLLGNFDGQGNAITDMAAQLTGLFNVVDSSAFVSNLFLDNALIYIDPTDAQWTVSGDTIYVHIVAKQNFGDLSSIGFAGKVIIDESKLPEGKVVVVCLVAENAEGANLNGFFFDTDLLASSGGNKRCITIKQNLGSIKNHGKNKVATSKASDNKSLPVGYEYTEEELRQSERAFTADEFASGVVAYWLNWTEEGYTGEYKPIYRQGAEYPVLATSVDGVSNALYKVSYDVDDDSEITDAPIFANNGDDITISYAKAPLLVTNGTTVITLGDNSTTFTFDASAPVVIRYASTALHTVSDSASDSYELYDLSGRKVSPAQAVKGIYVKKSLNGSQIINIK